MAVGAFFRISSLRLRQNACPASSGKCKEHGKLLQKGGRRHEQDTQQKPCGYGDHRCSYRDKPCIRKTGKKPQSSCRRLSTIGRR
nr:MAG TPA: hypothetical protein [Caudoviricetes sp.]